MNYLRMRKPYQNKILGNKVGDWEDKKNLINKTGD